MQRSRLGVGALCTAGALWAQLALIPLAIAGSLSTGLGVAATLADLLAIALPVVAVFIAASRPRAATTLMLAGFPMALCGYALLCGPQPIAQFDPPARMIAAFTAVTFVVIALLWAQSLHTAAPVVVTILDPSAAPRPSPPPLRGAVLLMLGAMAAFFAVIAPALISEHDALSRSDRLGGAPLASARQALTSAGGLAIALTLVLGRGSALMRGRSSRRRRATRGLAFLVWGVAVLGLKILVDRLR